MPDRPFYEGFYDPWEHLNPGETPKDPDQWADWVNEWYPTDFSGPSAQAFTDFEIRPVDEWEQVFISKSIGGDWSIEFLYKDGSQGSIEVGNGKNMPSWGWDIYTFANDRPEVIVIKDINTP